MPLGKRPGDTSESRYCGVEAEFDDDLSQLLFSNLWSAGFDFLVVPLMDPSYRPSLMQNENGGSGVLPFAGSDLVLSPAKWSSRVIGKISSWIDLDSENEILRIDSETTLKQEISWASHLSLEACLLPAPKGTSYANYARCVHQILQGLSNMQLWLSIPLAKVDDDSTDVNDHWVDYWDLWNSFRLLCEHHSQLSVALDILSTLPSPNSLERWFGESVRAALISTDCFLTDSLGHPQLSDQHQELITRFFNHSIRVVLSGKSLHNVSRGYTGVQSHALGFYLDHVYLLYQRMGPLPEQEQSQFEYRDAINTPLQPLMDNLDSHTYVNFETDAVKYKQYRRAIVKALKDRVSDDKATSITTVLMVVGAGRGPLVRAALQAAEETGRKLKVYAVEKNPNAVVSLHSLVKIEGWETIVTIISCDMRHWDASEKADILVSELLGSFADNELSPECLDGAQRFLKEDGISIPSSYTNFLEPITASMIYNEIKDRKDVIHFESAYVVKLHSVTRLSAPQPVFTFTHPNRISEGSNQRYKKLVFEIPDDIGAALVHGFGGYFDATLYGDVHLGIEPSSATPEMFSWFPIFFPLRTPMCVQPGSSVQLHFWRCGNPNKVWYEWCVTSPTQSPLHNSNGRSYWIGL